MPVRLAAMPRTPDDGLCCDAPESLPLSAATGLVRRLERLGWSAAMARSTETACSTSTTGTGFGLGLGLTTPSKPIAPNRGETTAAREGTAVETATASSAGAAAGAAAGLACGVSGDADAGRLNEATSPPETASTAEALPIGLVERDSADESAETGLGAPGARWRPGVGLGTCVDLSKRLRGELSGSGGRC